MVKKNEVKVDEKDGITSRFFSNKKDRFLVYIVVKSGDSFDVQAKKRIRATTKSVKIAENCSKVINIGRPTFRESNKRFYVVDVMEGQLTLGDLCKGGDSYADLILEQEIIKQFAIKLGSGRFGLGYMFIIALIGLGAFIGYILRGFIA